MLTAEENEQLTHVGPGTVMGNLLRRYWTPACLSSELPENETSVRVRLLGEDLVAFRTTDGTVGLIEEHCPHRGASLYYGRNEENGLRCVYHGWKFDTSGQCVDMPSERRSFADQIKATVYPTHESGGIVWTYMGPQESMTPFRDFGTETLPAEFQSASKLFTSCNWIQCMDGNVDTVHIGYLHSYRAAEQIPDDGTDVPGYPTNQMSSRINVFDKQPRLEVQDDWYGFRYAGIRDTPNGNTAVRITTFVVPYSTMIANIPFSTNHLMVVPIDDYNSFRYSFATQQPSNPRNLGRAERTLNVGWPYHLGRGPGVAQRTHVAENEYQIDRASQKNETYSGILDFVSQDLMVTETMGPIYDRTMEHLGTTDLAVIRMHSALLEAAQALAEGAAIPALAGGGDFRSIRGAEKILGPGEDWRVLGTADDEVVKEAELALHQGGNPSASA